MKIKILLSINLLGLIVLMGCGNSEKPNAYGGSEVSEQRLRVGVVYDQTGHNDRSFNSSVSKGVSRAANDLGVEVLEVDSKSSSDYRENILALVEQKMDLIVVAGVQLKQALEGVAKEHPESKFVYICHPVHLPNVRSIVFKEAEGSYLAGCAAALATKADRLGFVGGAKIPIIQKFYCGFVAGAKNINPEIEVEPIFVGNFDDISKAKSASDVLFERGAKVVFHAAGKAGLGVLRSAQDNHRLAIGVDSDQDDICPGFILTSVLKKCDRIVYETILDLKEKKFVAGVVDYGVKEGGMGLTEMKYTKNLLNEEDRKKIKKAHELIASGEIVVPNNEKELAMFLAS